MADNLIKEGKYSLCLAQGLVQVKQTEQNAPTSFQKKGEKEPLNMTLTENKQFWVVFLISLRIIAGPGIVQVVWLGQERQLFCTAGATVSLHLNDFHSMGKRDGEIWLKIAKMELQMYRWLEAVTLVSASHPVFLKWILWRILQLIRG